MSVHFSSQRLDWKTPKAVYQILDSEFHFDHDPCPPDYKIDGLTSEWGGCNYVKMELCDAQCAKKKSPHQISESEQIGQEATNMRVGDVATPVAQQPKKPKASSKERLLRSTSFYRVVLQDALDVKLLNLLATITSQETTETVTGTTPTAYSVVGKTLDALWQQKEATLYGQILSKLNTASIDIQKKGSLDIVPEVLLEIINQEALSSTGLSKIGVDAELILETNVLVANPTDFLLKTILYLCQMKIAQERYLGTLSRSAKAATPENTLKTRISSLTRELLSESTDTSQLCIRITSPAKSVFVNPPYGRELPKWIAKGYEQWQKGKTVVFLIPSRTDTRWWHDFCMKATEIRFIKGRLKFDDQENSAPFPSVIIIFRANE